MSEQSDTSWRKIKRFFLLIYVNINISHFCTGRITEEFIPYIGEIECAFPAKIEVV